MAGRVNAMCDAHTYLTQHHAFDYEQAEYLLQFSNPLEIVADKWEARISDLSDISFDVDKVFYDRDAEINGYELESAGTTTAMPENVSKTSFVEKETERIISAFKELTEPNSPNKTHFTVPLSQEFMILAGSNDQGRLLDSLPYNGAALTGLKGEKGIFVTVPKDELHKKTSIRAQLTEAVKEVSARPASEPKDKNKEKEVL